MPNALDLRSCLADYATRFEGRGHYPQRLRLAEFTGASYDNTVVYWLAGKYQPSGEKKWKATVFFHLIGYTVEAFERLRPDYQTVLLLMGYGLADPKELAAVFGYTGEQAVTQFYAVLSRNTELSAQKMDTIHRFAMEHQSAAENIVADVQRDYAEVVLATTEEKTFESPAPVNAVVSPLPAPTISQPNAGLNPRQAAHSLAYLIKAAEPLAKFLESDDVGDDVRDLLRKLSGSDAGGVFRLANSLTRLCGARARMNIKERG